MHKHPKLHARILNSLFTVVMICICGRPCNFVFIELIEMFLVGRIKSKFLSMALIFIPHCFVRDFSLIPVVLSVMCLFSLVHCHNHEKSSLSYFFRLKACIYDNMSLHNRLGYAIPLAFTKCTCKDILL